jgi:hypothetical protein
MLSIVLSGTFSSEERQQRCERNVVGYVPDLTVGKAHVETVSQATADSARLTN